MRVLLYSMVLYLSGIAAILYFRPSQMFRNDGRWKEFGVNSVETTRFPFWLFCIVWAVVSYGIVRLFFSDEEDHVSRARHVRGEAVAIPPIPVPQAPVQPELASGASGAAPPDASSGYYKLDTELMKQKGVPKYIYIGTEKPVDMYE